MKNKFLTKGLSAIIAVLMILSSVPVFAATASTEIDRIVVVDVEEPAPGEYPTYSANVLGAGYYINTEKNAYYDVYWTNPPQKWYYIKNGVGWFDLTKGDWMYEHEKFIPGHEYQINVYLETKDGYTFAHDKWLEMLFTATVNGQSAKGNTSTSDGYWYQTIKSSFVCQEKQISFVSIYNIAPPKAGETPDYNVSFAYPEYYNVDTSYGTNGSGIVWMDNDGNELAADDRFKEGEIYSVQIRIVPPQVEGVYVSNFISSGDIPTVWINDVPLGDSMLNGAIFAPYAALIQYTFEDGALPADRDGFIGGTVKSFLNDTDPVYVQLIPEGETEVAYETVGSGKSFDWSISYIIKGDYTVRIFKKNHATREVEMEITRYTVLDTTLNLIGDVNSDGKLNSRDSLKLNSYLKSGTSLNEYQIKCADINGDGRINSRDMTNLKRHLSGDKTLWE